MRKIQLIAFFSLTIVADAFTQSPLDTLVLLQGVVLSATDSTPVSGTIRYEKLPYYDDIGVATAKADGTYEIQAIKGKSYIVSANKVGFKAYEKEVLVSDNMLHNIYLKEDVLELKKLDNLNFSRGSDQISPSSFQELDELAEWLNENPSIIIQLEGHTDFAGNLDANMRLSEARVLAIQEYLVDKKVKKNRLFTKAFGGTQPLTRERTDEGKARNRRVEVRVIRR